jgi:hypothetical protein
MKEKDLEFLNHVKRSYKLKSIYSKSMVNTLRRLAKPDTPEDLYCPECLRLACIIEDTIAV